MLNKSFFKKKKGAKERLDAKKMIQKINVLNGSPIDKYTIGTDLICLEKIMMI